MPVTQAQITAAVDALAVQRLQAQMQDETYEAYVADVASVQAFRTAMAAAANRQAAAAEAMVTSAADLLNADQEAYLRLFDMCMRTRLGPAQITSMTTDSVLQDIVTKAQYMADLAWLVVKAKLDTLK